MHGSQRLRDASFPLKYYTLYFTVQYNTTACGCLAQAQIVISILYSKGAKTIKRGWKKKCVRAFDSSGKGGAIQGPRPLSILFHFFFSFYFRRTLRATKAREPAVQQCSNVVGKHARNTAVRACRCLDAMHFLCSLDYKSRFTKGSRTSFELSTSYHY